MYCLKLCIDGVWRSITLDNYFPIKHGKPAFTHGNELWPMLVEKAWAKVFKNYTNIIGGYPREVLRAITGAPTKTIFTD